MAYEDKPGDFALFPVREKKSDKGPDFTGYFVLPDGKKAQLAAWSRNRGVISGKRDERAEQKPQEDAPDRRDIPHVDDDAEIPW